MERELMFDAVIRRGAMPVAFFLVLCCSLAAQDSLLTISEMAGEVGVGKCLAPIGDYNNDGKDDIIVVSTAMSTTTHDVIRIYDDGGAILATHNLPNNESLGSVLRHGRCRWRFGARLRLLDRYGLLRHWASSWNAICHYSRW